MRTRSRGRLRRRARQRLRRGRGTPPRARRAVVPLLAPRIRGPVLPRLPRPLPGSRTRVPLVDPAAEGRPPEPALRRSSVGADRARFQEGFGSGAIWGIEATRAINVEMPIVVLAFLFGVSMDYQVSSSAGCGRRTTAPRSEEHTS